MGKFWEDIKTTVNTIKWILLVLSILAGVVAVIYLLAMHGCGKPEDEKPRVVIKPDLKGFGNTSKERRADVVFIHGLDGNLYDTWFSAGPPPFYFPEELAKEKDFADLGFWSVEYPASSTEWYGSNMPIQERAKNLLSYLHDRDERIGSKPVVFVTHSLGGLVAKKMIVSAYTKNEPDWQGFKDNTKGIAFIATPHRGSSIPGYLERLTKVLPGLAIYRASGQLDQLGKTKANIAMLTDLGEDYKRTVPDNFKTLALYENEGVAGAVTVVGLDDADPGITTVLMKGIDADHISICKPTSKTDAVYLQVRNFIRSALQPPTRPISDTFLYFREQQRQALSRGGDALQSLNTQYANGRIDWIGFVENAIPAADDTKDPHLVVNEVKDGKDGVLAYFPSKKFPAGIAKGTRIRIAGTIQETNEFGAVLIDCEQLPLAD